MRRVSAHKTIHPRRERMRTGQRRRCRLTIEGLESRQMLAALPLPEHVVVVIEENHDYSQIVGSTSAPYINSLAQQGALMTDSTAIEHPSQPNYLDLFSGSNQGVVDDNRPAGLPFTTPNLGAELQAANLSFVGYSESLPTAGFDGDSYTSVAGQNQYQRKHNPWTDFINDPVGVNQMPSSVNQPFSSFPTDFARLPAVAIVVPNEQNDMHDGTVQQGDTWLKNNVDGYVQWAKNHNSLLVVTWDENDSSPGNHITTIFAGPMVQPGQYGEPVNHFNVLRTLEDMYRLPDAGASAGAAPITDIWTAPTVTASQKYVTAVYQDVLGRGPDLAGLVHWSSLLDQGTANSSVAEAIGHSDEYYGNFVIKPDYLNLLGRPADAAGVTYWTRRMQNGLTDQQLEAGFAASDEFYAKAGENLDPAPDADDTSVADTDHTTDWIDAIYKLLLGRLADGGGETYWNGQMTAGVSRGDVALSIANSAENDSQLINSDYVHYLGRAADAGGLAYWLRQFAAGKTNEDVIAGFTGSDEYYKQHTG